MLFLILYNSFYLFILFITALLYENDVYITVIIWSWNMFDCHEKYSTMPKSLIILK